MAQGLGISIKSFKPKTKAATYTATVHRDVTRIWQESARAFVRSIVTDSIHIDTGMSAASVLPLAAALRFKGKVQSTIRSQSRGPRKGYGDPMDYSKWRSIRHGMKLGERAYKLSYGTAARTLFQFEFNITVYQHSFHEELWNTIPKAEQAFLASLNAQIDDYGVKLRRDLKSIFTGGV